MGLYELLQKVVTAGSIMLIEPNSLTRGSGCKPEPAKS